MQSVKFVKVCSFSYIKLQRFPFHFEIKFYLKNISTNFKLNLYIQVLFSDFLSTITVCRMFIFHALESFSRNSFIRNHIFISEICNYVFLKYLKTNLVQNSVIWHSSIKCLCLFPIFFPLRF